MQVIPCRRGLACARGSSSGSSSSGSGSSSRHATAYTLLHPSTQLGAAARRRVLPLPAVRISCSGTRTRVQGVPPLRDHQAHELPASWRSSLNGTESSSSDNANSNSNSKRNANGYSKHESSGNTGPVQSYQALFQQHASGVGSSSMQRLVSLRFSIEKAVEYGQRMRLVGSPDCLGAWDAEQGPDMKWHEGHKWTAYVELAAGSHEFKYVLVHRSGKCEWEPGSNRVLEVPGSAAEMQVAGQWGDTSDTEALELLEQPKVSERRRKQQQLVEAAEVATTAGAVEPAAAVAAAKAADALWSVLDLDKQSQMQPPSPASPAAAVAAAPGSAAHTAGGVSQQQIDMLLQVMKSELGSARTEEDAAAAATAAVDAASGVGSGVPTPQQIQQLMQALRAELSPAGADAAAGMPSASLPVLELSPATAHDSSSSSIMVGAAGAAAADVASAVQLDAQLAAHNNELVSTLLEMRSELVSSISEVTAAVHEVQDELADVQQYVAQLATERFMMMMQQQQQQGLGADAAAVAAAVALDGVGVDAADAAAWREVERQLMSQQQASEVLVASGSSSGGGSGDAAAAAGSSGQSSWKIRWKDGTISSSSYDAEPAAAVTAVLEPAGDGGHVRPVLDVGFAGSAGAATSLAGNLQLSPAVMTWRQEVLQFRQESKILRTELHGLNDVLDSMQQQLVANTAAIHNLQAAVLADDSSSGSSSKGTAKLDPQAATAAELASAVAAAAAQAGEPSTGGSQLQEQLLAKFDQLAVDLKEEVKHAVEAVAAAKQQQPVSSRQNFSFDDFVSQLWTAPPPQELQRKQQQREQVQTDSTQQKQQSSSSVSSTAREEAAAAVEKLASRNVEQYHKGLLVCVMMAAGVWEEGLLDIIRGTAMRNTWRAYKAAWSEKLVSELKQQLTTPQAVLAELQHGSSAADELACHILWSLHELSTHSTRVALLLKQVYNGQEAALMQQLAPGARQQQCAAVLLRWIAAASME